MNFNFHHLNKENEEHILMFALAATTMETALL